MNETDPLQTDPLQPVLREWTAPEPPAGMDARIRSAYRAQYRPSPWRSFWSARVSVPIPVLAALMLMAAAVSLMFRAATPVPRPALHISSSAVDQEGDRSLETRLDATGFQPLPNGAARVVKMEGVSQ